jgi:transitional endoplasmic reticulum ATPase
MFANDDGEDVAIAELEESAPDVVLELASEFFEDKPAAPEGQMVWPEFMKEIDNVYRSNSSHVFLLHGNVNDYPDNSGVRSSLAMSLYTRYDYYWTLERQRMEALASGQPFTEPADDASKIRSVTCTYTIPDGLVFASVKGFEIFEAIMRSDPTWANRELHTPDLRSTLVMLNAYFRIAAVRYRENRERRLRLAHPQTIPSVKQRLREELAERPEINLTILLFDAKMCFPAGPVSQLVPDRTPIAYLERWALDGSIANRNKIILVSQRVSDVQQSLRTGDSHVTTIRVGRPTVADRREWIHNFQEYIKITPPLINGKARRAVTFAEDLTNDIVANNASGMSRFQIEGVFMESWLKDEPVDLGMISGHKRKAIEAEYGDILDIRQPVEGMETLGYHTKLKKYAEEWIIEPLLLGDKRRCTRGVALTGPPGTGKTKFALCVAATCKMNFLLVDLSKLFGGIVGETEENTRRLFEAIDEMAPCIVFFDEFDSAAPSRQTSGDSGVGARIFNRIMVWMSDPARWGRVVAMLATNRPDMIDAAMLRAGRFDDLLPTLPPLPGDVAGRKSILLALSKGLDMKFHRSLATTMDKKNEGLGRLLHDARIWTGAEMERLVKLAYGKAAQREADAARAEASEQKLDRRDTLALVRTKTKTAIITEPDWNQAFAAYRPQTGDMQAQIDLALRFCNNLDYVPDDWRARLEQIGSASEPAPAAYTGALDYERD